MLYFISTDDSDCNDPHMFRCDDGVCIDASRVCNNVDDCALAEDEFCLTRKIILIDYRFVLVSEVVFHLTIS